MCFMISGEQRRALESVFPGVSSDDNGDTLEEMQYDELTQNIKEQQAKHNQLTWEMKRTFFANFPRRTKLNKELSKLSNQMDNLCRMKEDLLHSLKLSKSDTVKWTVLAKANNLSRKSHGEFLLLTTKKAVAMRRFDEKSNKWETSELRSWLNKEFYLSLSGTQKRMLVAIERRDYESDWLNDIDRTLYNQITNNNPYALNGNRDVAATTELVSLLNTLEVRGLIQGTKNMNLKYRHQAVDWWTNRPYWTSFTGPLSNPGMHINYYNSKFIEYVSYNELLPEKLRFQINGMSVNEVKGVRPIVVINMKLL